MEELRKIIGKNLSELRKNRGLTQLELAEKFNYTDRAVSKWENGDTLPDVDTLYMLCEFYGVTLDYLTHEDNYQFIKENREVPLRNKISITVLAGIIAWLLATVVFVVSLLQGVKPLWVSFIWAVPLSALFVIFFNRLFFRKKLVYFINWSLLIWGTITATFLSFLPHVNLWPLFLIGVPAQAILIIWTNIIRVPKQKKIK